MKTFESSFGHLTSIKHGTVVSSILITATISGFIAGSISDIYGRATALILGATIFGIGATLEAASQSLLMFVFGRLISGFGEGIYLGNMTVYICEIAPARRRGPLASYIQFAISLGVAVGFFMCYGTSRIAGSSMSWRVPLLVNAVVAFAYAGACVTIPPSPRWLQAKGRLEDARVTLEKLGLASSELEDMSDQQPVALAERAQAGFKENFIATLKDTTKCFRKGARSRAALACFLMAFQQFSGIDGVLYYAPTLFQRAGLASEQASFLASGVSALLMFAVTIPASIFSDHWGRRSSAIVGGISIAGIMLLIGSLYAANVVYGDHGIARWVVIVSIYLFAILFSITWAISFKIYASEIQPTYTRASASSLAQSANWVCITTLLPLNYNKTFN